MVVAGDGPAAAMPAELVAAAQADRLQSLALASCGRRLQGVQATSGCKGGAAVAVQDFVARWAGPMQRLVLACDDLARLAEGTAGEFRAADGG